MSTRTRLFTAAFGLYLFSAGCNNDATAAEIKTDKMPVPAAAESMTNKVEKTGSTTGATPATLTPPVETTADTTENKKPELSTGEGLQLAELTVARGIESKKPLDPKTEYTLGEYDRIVAFMSVLNPAETEDEVQVSFLNVETGKERGKVSVRIGAQKKWRTWAFSRHINKAGKWEILVRDKDDQLLGRAPFEILPAN